MDIRLQQHVFGRVTRGVELPGPGYQLAAATESLRSRTDLIEKLNRFSFARKWEGKGPAERYSLLRPAPGWVSFGCARVTKDLSGAVGSFAHNFVCPEEEFVKAGVSPVAVFRSLRFLAAESDLPSSRVLDTAKVTCDSGSVVMHPEWRAAVLELIDIYLGESALVVPLVVIEPSIGWDVLEELFSLLPRRDAARLTFSTLFVDAAEFVDGYRLVFVPDRENIQDLSVFRVVEPVRSESPRVAKRAVPLTSFWRSRPQEGAALCRAVDLLRQDPDGSEIGGLLEDLLQAGRLFREAVESLDVKTVYSWLVRNSGWLQNFREAGGPLSEGGVREAVWADPAGRLVSALEGAERCRESELVARLYEDLGRRVAEGGAPVSLVETVSATGHLRDFLRVVSDPNRFDDGTLIALAERLEGAPSYAGQIHYMVARRALSGIERDERRRPAERWLARYVERRDEAFFRAVVGLIESLDSSAWRRTKFRLRDFATLSEDSYRIFLRVLWRVASSPRDFAEMALCADGRRVLFEFCAQTLRASDFDTKKDLLRAVIDLCQPVREEHFGLIEAVAGSADAYALAKHYINFLERQREPDREALARLQSIPKPRAKDFWR